MPSKIEEAERPLSQLINTATRSVHTKLNKLVVSRLPLALPPQTQDASNYVSGLLHITPIYIAFESLWQKILDLDTDAEENSPTPDAHLCNVCESEIPQSESPDIQILPSILEAPQPPVMDLRIRFFLTNLHIPELARAEELQKDIIALTGWSSHTVAEHLSDAAESEVLGEFLHHIKHSVEERPHILLAYAWVLYMALFSGGRIIRATLEQVHASFWIPLSASAHLPTGLRLAAAAAAAAAGTTESGPLRFFSFAGPNDDGSGGQDLKVAFKQRLAESESTLTDEERDDIVAEARHIFAYMVRLVSELDDICETDPQAGRMLSLRSRDSVVVEKERRALAELVKRVASEDAQGSSA